MTKPTSANHDALASHFSSCADCRLTVARQRVSLAEGGCSQMRELIRTSGVGPDSPLRLIHLTEEAVEEHYFRRHSDFETQLFKDHVNRCGSCAVTLHNELLFIYAMTAALSDPSEFRNRSGASFSAQSAAA